MTEHWKWLEQCSAIQYNTASGRRR